ncbi:MAG: hypothetical protein CMN30_02825 [Sandaracinus sp.]|nr:hypothetical protein [Sandaracinus sp.]|tara:strand:+ start:780 stop:1889 length:1110 start_codon:yes stop_codon:yes gene_type:complete
MGPLRTTLRSLLAACGLALALGLAAPVAAQHTGSSFGGGGFGGGSSYGGGGGFGGGSSYGGSSSWGGGSSSWGGGSSSWGGGSSSWSSGSSTSSYSGGGGSTDPLFLGIMIAILIVIVIAKATRKHPFHGAMTSPSYSSPAPPITINMDVTALMVAVDVRARAAIQAQLDAMARSGDTATAAGRRRLLAAAIAALEEHRAAWVYVGSHDARPAAPPVAEANFQRMTGDLRSRFRHELLRNREGATATQDAPGSLKARPEEGDGLCVISVVVAARRTLADLDGIADPERFRQAFRVLRSLSTMELVAFEVIWSPSAEDDRMSSAELEVLYPELHRLAGEPLGRVACPHCGATYACELGQCPSCGAPPPPA